MSQKHSHLFSTASRQGIGPFAPCVAWLFAVSASACATSDEPTPPSGAGGTGPAPTDAVGRMLDGPQTCTVEHTICAKMQVPTDLEGTPESLQFTLYDSPDPPAHPPNAFAGIFPAALVVPGEMQYFELTDAGLVGDYWLWVIMYMPGGGLFGLPVFGIDYGMISAPQALPLDGTPLNLEDPVVLVRLPAQ
jgi:hypothetical protein